MGGGGGFINLVTGQTCGWGGFVCFWLLVSRAGWWVGMEGKGRFFDILSVGMGFVHCGCKRVSARGRKGGSPEWKGRQRLPCPKLIFDI